MALGLTVPQRTRRVVASDLENPDPRRVPPPISARGSALGRGDPLRRSCGSRSLGRSTVTGRRVCLGSCAGAGVRARGPAPPRVLRPFEAARRNRHLRRPLSRAQQRGARDRAGADRRLRRRDDLRFRYGVRRARRSHAHEPIRLSPSVVSNIHHDGGTFLGTSRGEKDPAETVDRLVELGIGALFVVGGDGTFRGAMRLVEEIARRDLAIGVVGVPKTIDNDIHFIDRSFGFETAFSAAVDVIKSAHVEAVGAKNGIGLVKLMGRHSGFIACHAALASTDVDFVLIPRCPSTSRERAASSNLLEQRLRSEAPRRHRRRRRGRSGPLQRNRARERAPRDRSERQRAPVGRGRAAA